MGRPKESLPIDGTTMLGRQCRTLLSCTDAVIVVGREPEQELPPLPDEVHLAHDATPGEGPLEAIVAGLRHARDALGFATRDAMLVTGCDQPFLTPATVRWLASWMDEASDVLMPRAAGRLQPLTAVYRLTALAPAEALLRRGGRRPRELADAVPSRVLDEDRLREHDPELRFLRNLNHADDYARALRELGG